jgi:hypothetical protein
LPFGWGGHHLGLVVNKIFPGLGPKEFNITIAVEALGKGDSRTAKESDCRKNGVGKKVFQSKHPVISGSLVNQDKSIAETTNGKTVTKSNVHVYSIKVLVFCLIERPTTGGNSPPSNHSPSRLTRMRC